MTRQTQIAVVGGGYSGVLAANRLTQRDDVAITLINPRDRFVERIRLHQLAAGTHEAVVDFADVLAERVRLVVDTAMRIDAGGRRVVLAKGVPVPYDHLVYAVGSHGRAPDVPGSEHAHSVVTLEGAARLRSRLSGRAGAAVSVVGAGSTGLEVAAELADEGHAVTLVCGGELNPWLHPRGRDSVKGHLARLGVTVIDGDGTTVTEVGPDTVTMADGRVLPSEVTVWTAGFAVPTLARDSGLATDDAGRLLTDETLTSVTDPRVVGTGDASSPSGTPFRMCCASATQLGLIGADTLLARLAGQPPAPLAVGFAGQCIALGRQDAVLQVARRDDTTLPVTFGGRPVGALKESVSRAITRQLGKEARRPGSFRIPGWIADPRRDEALRAAEQPARHDVAPT